MTRQEEQHQSTSSSKKTTATIANQSIGSNWSRFILLWIASSTNYFAYWAMQLALPLFASQLTKSPLLVSGITFVRTVPYLVLALLGGVLVDRYDRRNVLLTVTFLRVLTFSVAILASLLGYTTLPLLYGVVLMLGITQTVEEPAFAASVPMVVRAEKLVVANAWLAGAQNFVELFAVPVGGILASVSIALTMGVGAGCAVMAFLVLLSLRGSYRPGQVEKRHILIEIMVGIRFLWNTRVLRTLGLMAAVINACWSAYLTILVLYAVAPGPMGLTAISYGLLMISSSVGGVISPFIFILVQRWLGRRWAIGLNILGNAVMFATPACTTNVWMIGGAAVLGGIVGPLWTIEAASLLARTVPTTLLGRVNAAYNFLGLGALSIGAALGGVFAQLLGLRVVFAICGCLTLLMLFPFFTVITEQAMKRAKDY